MTSAAATLTADRPEKPKAAPSALRSGALMAAGSLVSRATGFVRAAVVAAALGAGYVADGYAVGNSVPTIVYMLLLGGALNAVFVPELVKAAKEHEDGGVAYTDRLLTLCALALTVLTAAAVLAAPLIVDLYTDYTGERREMTVAFARACLPQILFLGLFTLLGQVLNARGRFGAMMWTPVLNNVVVVAVFGLFLVVSDGGTLTPARPPCSAGAPPAASPSRPSRSCPRCAPPASAGGPASTGAAAASGRRCARPDGWSCSSSPTRARTG